MAHTKGWDGQWKFGADFYKNFSKLSTDFAN
jgi:hypothetical protein